MRRLLSSVVAVRVVSSDPEHWRARAKAALDFAEQMIDQSSSIRKIGRVGSWTTPSLMEALTPRERGFLLAADYR